MLFVATRSQVATDGASRVLVTVGAEAVRDELQVLFQMLARPGFRYELYKSLRDVIGEPSEFSDRDNAVPIGGKGGILARIEACVEALGIDQPRLVQAVTAHHAPDR